MLLARRASVLATSSPVQRSLGTLSTTGTPATTNVDHQQRQKIHLTTAQDYPQVAPLPLPENIDPNESIQFSPLRSRDLTLPQITEMQSYQSAMPARIEMTCDYSAHDPHVASYDCRGSVSLNCMMQSMVPEPFEGAKFTHLNMPGGQWAQSGKFLSQNIQALHYTNLRQEVRADWDKKGAFAFRRSFHSLTGPSAAARATNPIGQAVLKYAVRALATATPPPPPPPPAQEEEPKKKKKEDKASKLKQTVKEYGSTVIVFHVAISLASLGMFYTLVSSGLDVVAVLEYLNLSDSVLAGKVGTGASTFVIAYAVHKVFAPVRISITLGATPFIVRALRKRGILKAPKSN